MTSRLGCALPSQSYPGESTALPLMAPRHSNPHLDTSIDLRQVLAPLLNARPSREDGDSQDYRLLAHGESQGKKKTVRLGRLKQGPHGEEPSVLSIPLIFSPSDGL